VTDRVAIVTGGGGGIGGAVATRLAGLGFRVVVADADADAARRVHEALPGAGPHAVVVDDLTTGDANARLADRAASLGTPTVVVNALGISPKTADGRRLGLRELDETTWDRVMAVNVRAPFLLCRAVADLLPDDGSASIVNILSVTGQLAAGGPEGSAFPPRLPSSPVYAASKAALANLTMSVARELVDRGIRVNGVAPGFISTPMANAVGAAAGTMAEQIPMGRFGLPEDVADAVEYLVSERARYVTGACLDVNGGLVMR
jgi:3-oxoacyl-[acyl-carrier protein] reductase